MKFIQILFLITVSVSPLFSQSIESINASFDGERVTISYSLNHPENAQKFKIEIYSSHDNYTHPLQVTGDAGENVTPGRNRVVVWNAKEVLPSEFDSDIRIKVKGTRMAAPPIAVEPLSMNAYKKGRTISLKWSGGYSSDMLNLELKKNNVVSKKIATQLNNSGTYDWKIPKNVKGKNYRLQLVNSSQGNSMAESSSFTIKPKTPFIVKVLPILVGGAVVYFLTGSDTGGDDGGGNPPQDVLPAPVKPN